MDREKAIEYLEWIRPKKPYTQDKKNVQIAIDMGIEALKEERPRGEWRDFSDMGFVECPFCEHATNCDDNIEELHFCFFCGAELRKSGEKK